MEQTELIYKRTFGLVPFAYTIVEKWLYFCDQQTPGLFRYHLETEESECIAKFNINYVNWNFFKIVAHKDDLWMLPFFDGKIVCFNRKTQAIFYYDISPEVQEKTIPFIDVIFSEEAALFIPHGSNRFLIKVDLLTHDVQKIELLKGSDKEKQIFFTGAIRVENKIYLTEHSKRILVVFHMFSKQIETIHIDSYSLENIFLTEIENKLYFFPVIVSEGQKVLIYDINNDYFIEKEYPIKRLPQKETCIPVLFNRKIWILANKQRKIYRINENLEIESEISILNFNKENIEIYVSGLAFDDRFFWNGFNEAPLIEGKDDTVRILDVNKQKNILEIYMDMIETGGIHEGKQNRLGIGEEIYKKVIAM